MKKFEIAAKTKDKPAESKEDRLDSFIAGNEPFTTMTIQIPERLKFKLKEEALRQRTTMKDLIIEMLSKNLQEH
ncbi:MAG: hypothetical protein HQK96_15505 [Nitrospirae bacterium]|nr:hypothetical protein [Nitrospirota bacterium]